MARCLISNPKTLRRLRRITGLPVVSALTRGNTGHRYDLRLDGESTISFYGSWSYLPSSGICERVFRNGRREIKICSNT